MRWFAVLLVCLACAAEVDTSAFGPNHGFRLEYSRDEFGMRCHGIVEVINGHARTYPLPQSTFEDYARLRPDSLRVNPLKAADYRRQEVMGPHQLEGLKLWFGNHFYDGEGMRGVGTFGYFDMETRQYRVFRISEAAPYEISAMLVERDEVWLGLEIFGEDIGTSPGGLTHWNRETEKAHRIPLEFVVASISRIGESLRLTTKGGYALLLGSDLQRYTSAGNPIDKFPPAPTHN